MEYETKYFKTKETGLAEESVMRARIVYSNFAENPRNPRYQTNLGTIVIKSWNDRTSGCLGDENIKDWREYFEGQLEVDRKTFSNNHITVKIPSVEEARKNEKLSRYIAGTVENGFRFDKELLVQDVEASCSYIRSENENLLDNIECGIELDENQQRLKDELYVSFKTTGEKNYNSGDLTYDERRTVRDITNQVTSLFEDLELKFEGKSFLHDTLDEMTDFELFKKWNENNLVCFPISTYEHSGIALYLGSEGDVSHREVHEKFFGEVSYDNDHVREDGFIFVRKDNQEVLNELKGEARDSKGNVYNQWKPKTLEETKEWAKGVLKAEFDEYNAYVQGEVYDVTFEKLNSATLEWDEVETVNNICEKNIDAWITDRYTSNKMLLSRFISKEEAEKLATTITPEYKESSWNKFLSEIKKELPNFDGKAEYASAAVLYAMNKNGSTILEKEALKQVMSEKGFSSKEKTIELLNKELGLSEKTIKQELLPLSFKNENKRIEKNVLKERER